MRSSVRVLAIVVTFHPERGTLSALLEALSAQVDEVLVVDNTPPGDDDVWGLLETLVTKHSGLRMVRLGGNQGIATALNVGIDVAIAEGFSHVLLSDQDSLPAASMVSGLLEAERNARSRGLKVGAVGPVYVDVLTGIEYPFQVHERGSLFYTSRFTSEAEPDVETLSLITSGCLIGTESLRVVGGMLEELFIDHVDVEWCLRAISKGFVNIGTRRAMLQHHMGDSCLRVWFFGWRNINGYGPVRLYYRFRNFVHILRLPYIRLSWKVRSSWYWAGNLYGHVFFGEKRVASLRAIFFGIKDGMGGVWGRPDVRLAHIVRAGRRGKSDGSE